jgi:hypothetical protein
MISSADKCTHLEGRVTMGQVIEFKREGGPAACEEGQDDFEAEAILEDWWPGKELVTAEGRQLLLDALELLKEQLFDQFRRSGASDPAVFQRLIWCDDLAYTLELAERIEVAIRPEPEDGDRSTLPGGVVRDELAAHRRLKAG